MDPSGADRMSKLYKKIKIKIPSDKEALNHRIIDTGVSFKSTMVLNLGCKTESPKEVFKYWFKKIKKKMNKMKKKVNEMYQCTHPKFLMLLVWSRAGHQDMWKLTRWFCYSEVHKITEYLIIHSVVESMKANTVLSPENLPRELTLISQTLPSSSGWESLSSQQRHSHQQRNGHTTCMDIVSVIIKTYLSLLFLGPFYRLENWGSKKSNLPNVTEEEIDRHLKTRPFPKYHTDSPRYCGPSLYTARSWNSRMDEPQSMHS